VQQGAPPRPDEVRAKVITGPTVTVGLLATATPKKTALDN